MKSAWFIFAFVTTLACSAGEAPRKDVPVLETTVIERGGTRPKYKELLSEQEYTTRAKKILAANDRTAAEKRGMVYDHARVSDVIQGSQAQKIGLKRNDLILTINGQPISDPQILNADKRPPDAKVVIRDMSGKERELVLPGGRLGFSTGSTENPAARFLSSGPRNAKWDDDVFVACLSFRTDPALAETALARAQKAGLPQDRHIDSVGTIAMMNNNRYADAIQMASSVFEKGPQGEDTEYLYCNLMLSQNGVGFYTTVYNGIGEAPVSASPIEKAAGYYRDSFFLKSNPPEIMGPELRRIFEGNTGVMAITGAYQGRLEPDMYNNFPYFPGGKNVEIVCKFSIDPGNFKAERVAFACLITLGFSRPVPMHDDHEGTYLQSDPFMKAKFVVSGGGGGRELDNLRKVILPSESAIATGLAKGSHDLHMVVLDDVAEVRLDGKRVYLGPLKCKENRWVPVMHTRDIHYRFESFAINELVDPKDANHPFFKESSKQMRAGKTRLHFATEQHRDVVVKALVESGARLDLKDQFGELPIHTALRQARIKLARYFREKGSPTDLTVLACIGTGDEVQASIKAAPKEINGTLSWTPLHGAAYSNNIETVKVLLDAGVDVNIRAKRNFREMTPLMWASQYGHVEMVKLLLGRGANPTLTDSEKATAYHYAERNGNKELLDLLKAGKVSGPSPAVRPPPPPNLDF